MIRRGWLVLAVCITLISAVAIAQEPEGGSSQKLKIPPGMKIVRVGNFYILVSKDSDMRHEGTFGQIVTPEGPEEYAARNFIEVNNHFEKNDAEIAALKKEVDELKAAVSRLKTE